MRIQVSGKQIDIGEALRSHVEDRLNEAVGKYFDRPVEAVVTFWRDRHEFCADSSVHLPTGLTVQAKAKADEIYASFEGSVERMEKQLRRYKRRWTLERTIWWFQNFRRLCTRCEKSTLLFQGFLHLGCSIILLRQVLG